MKISTSNPNTTEGIAAAGYTETPAVPGDSSPTELDHTVSNLRAQGLCLLPLPPRQKFSPPTGWTDTHSEHAFSSGSNIAVATGPARNGPVVVISNDERSTDYFSGLFGPPTVWSYRGAHWWFRAPPGTEGIPASTYAHGEMEMHSDGRYVLVPPSVHPSGALYRWDHGIPRIEDLAELPSHIRDLFGITQPTGRSQESAQRVAGRVPYGSRRRVLCREARTLARAGLTEQQIYTQLRRFQEAEFPPERPGDQPYEKGAKYVAGWAVRHHAPALALPVAVPPTPSPAPNYDHLWFNTDPDDPEGRWVPLRGEFENTLLAETRFLAFRDSREFRMYVPTRGFYVADAETYIAEWVRDRFAEKKTVTGQDLTASSGFVAEVVSTIRDRSYRDRSKVNPPWSLVLANGVFDVRTLELRPHASEPVHTFALPVAWDSAASAPRFEAFLSRALPDDLLRGVALEAAGYCLWPTTQLRRAFFAFGPTTTGKSTYLDTIRGVLGFENTTSVDLAELVDHRFKAAELFGRLANVRADLPAKLVRNTGLFQELTGGRDTITAERKHQHPFQFRPTAKLLFSANRLPRIPGVTPAFWVRWILMPFEVEVPKEENRPDYSSLLLEEANGIFRLMAEASRRLLERGRFPDLPLDVRDRWLRNSDPALYVCQNEITEAVGGCVDLRDVLARVDEVHEEEGIAEMPDAREVGAAMRRAHPRVRVERSGARNDRRTMYWGVAWTSGRAKPLAVAAPEFSDEKTPAGATGVRVINRGRKIDSYVPAEVVDPPLAPGTDSPSEGPCAATALDSEQEWQERATSRAATDPGDILGGRATRADRAPERLSPDRDPP